MRLWLKRAVRSAIAIALGATASLHAAAAGEIVVLDDTRTTVRLARPAERIISLAPNLTEMLFAIGAGERVVGTVEFSNHPPAARNLPRIGGSAVVDIERIVSLRPDLVIAWPHGAGQRQLAQLKRLGFAVFVSDPRTLDAIGDTLANLGRLAGTDLIAQDAAMSFRNELSKLRGSHAASAPLRVFLQIWSHPLMTVNNRHIYSDVLAVCGARNAFGSIPQLAPSISREAVIAANPDAIIAAASDGDAAAALAPWRKWPQIGAVRADRLFSIDPDRFLPLAPRILEGIRHLCDTLARNSVAARP